ncbi:hypothetical protein HMPREF1528_01811 [Capnocytophaga sp. oral taxon 336 str. F0502]|nr:hypothetical protein HMPREF1528_01811 [Capnocytophaga sp. oral taxon 336 str. F0502]
MEMFENLMMMNFQIMNDLKIEIVVKNKICTV